MVTSTRCFARGLRAEGFEGDHRRTPTMTDGLAAHVAACARDVLEALDADEL